MTDEMLSIMDQDEIRRLSEFTLGNLDGCNCNDSREDIIIRDHETQQMDLELKTLGN